MSAVALIPTQQSNNLTVLRPQRNTPWFPDLDAAAKSVERHTASLGSTKETEEKHTQEQYRRVIEGFRDWLDGDLPTIDVMEAYVESLASRNLSNVTINKYLAPIRLFLRSLSRQPIHPDVPDRDFRTASQIKDLIAAATEIQVKVRRKSNLSRLDQFNWRSASDLLTILHSIDRHTIQGKRDHAIIMLGVNSALRVNEIAHITLDNFTRHSDDTALIINLRGKGGIMDPIPVPLYVYDFVKAYVDAFNDLLPKDDSRRIANDQPIWRPLTQRGKIWKPLHKNKPLGRKGVTRIIQERTRAAGKPMNPHDLRRSTVAYLRSIGMIAEDAQNITRHQSLDMLKLYMDTGAPIWDQFNHFLRPGAVMLA